MACEVSVPATDGAAVRAGGTLHVVERVSESVFSVLGPATALLHEAGVPQTVVLLDRAEHAHRLLRFSDEVRLVPVLAARPAWRHWVALRRAVREQVSRSRPSAVHFHGALAWLCSVGLVGRRCAVYLSPHGSALLRLGAPLLRAMAALTRRRDQPTARERAPASSWSDLLALRHDGPAPPLFEGVVDDPFLLAPHRESRRPLIVSGCHDDNRKAVELFCRAAVIFGAPELNLAFNWCGPLSEAGAAQLKAAGIGIVSASDDAAMVLRLRSAWLYFAGGGETEFPVQLAQAMACGLPCLAADLPVYRRVIDDGVTGLLYRSEEEALQLLTLLIDDRVLRQRLGNAARRSAMQRFSRQRLRGDLLSLYRGVAAASPEPVDG
jgi:glycosyltransferase involved in cell wall biosynthesis